MNLHYRLLRKLILLSIILILTIWIVLFIYKQELLLLSYELSSNLEKIKFIHNSNKKINVIHISMIIGGANTARQSVVLIKSILDHFNWIEDCSFSQLDNFTYNNYKNITPNYNNYLPQIYFHLIIDKIAFQSLNILFKTWAIPGVYFSYYHLESYMDKISWIPTTHYSGLYGLTKLIIPEILPKSIHQVINLDTDVLVNCDLRVLWDYLKNFNQTQLIGMVKNQSPFYTEKSNPTVWPALNEGYNTGVMLLNLEKMHHFNWINLWTKTAEKILKFIPYAPLADQDIINSAILNRPDYVYELSCEWNVQMADKINHTQCPVIWFYPNSENICINCDNDMNNKTINLLKIVHINFKNKLDIINGKQNNDDLENKKSLLRNQFSQIYQHYQNYDGSLLKFKIYNALHNSCVHKQIPVKMIKKLIHEKNSMKGCEDFQADLLIQRRIYPYLFPYNLTNSLKTNKPIVSLISQLSFDRIYRIEKLALVWLGPMSLALYLTDHETSILIEFITSSSILINRTNIGYHIVFVDGKYYPINQLRNVAMKYASTEFVYYVDIDFIPMFNIMSIIENNIQKYIRRDEKICLIIPAFEIFKTFIEIPKNKTILLNLWKHNEILPFRHEIWSAGHMSTNYSRWNISKENYEVFWSADYEPYIVVSKYASNFDTRFVGFGWNKAAYIMDLDALGYKFIVLYNAFMIHLPHPPSIEVLRYRLNYVYRSCIDKLKLEYIKHLAQKYGVQALKYLQFRTDSQYSATENF